MTTCSHVYKSGWNYNSSNQITSAPAMGGMSGATGLVYDSSGNVTGYNGMTLSWDNWGQLTGVTNTPLGNVTYTYDAFGRRASKTVSGATTLYLYDGEALIGEVNGATGQLIRSYTWGTTGLISDHASTGSRYYMFDPAGNTRALLDANGNILAQQSYTPYGQQIGTALPTPFAWNGACGIYSDSETGLLFMRSRYYSPAIGRFISRDPIEFDGGINVYAYCVGDPVNFGDYDGAKPHSKWQGWLPQIPPGENYLKNCILIREKIRKSESASLVLRAHGVAIGAPDHEDIFGWWLSMVSNKGGWDYKRKSSREFESNSNRCQNDPTHGEFEQAGNFNFGATAAAMGFNLNFAIRAGAYYGVLAPQWKKFKRILHDFQLPDFHINPANGSWTRYPYGDSWDDVWWEAQGYYWYKQLNLK